MKVGDRHYRSIWYDGEADEVRIIDQRWLPHDFRIATLTARADFETAIRDMWIRGAPLIGATAAFGMAREMGRDPSDTSLDTAWQALNATRPTVADAVAHATGIGVDQPWIASISAELEQDPALR